MSAYDDDADRLAEHNSNTCDDPYCQICFEEEETNEFHSTRLLARSTINNITKKEKQTKCQM